MSFYFSPTNKNRFKHLRKSFTEGLNKNRQQQQQQTLRSSSPVNSLLSSSASTNSNEQKSQRNQQQQQPQSYQHQLIQKAETNNPLKSAMMPSVKSRLIKNISRTKEKILQGMGKTDKTEDENFDVYVENFERQYAQANKLNKELHKYLSCLRETHKSSRMFYETLKETYEEQWPMSGQFAEQIDLMEVKWTEYLNRLYKDVQLPLMSYLNEFPELKKKIEKRCNRLLDYDNARHSLESAQSKSLKKNTNTLNTSATIGHHTPNNNNNSSSSSSSSSNSTHHHQHHNTGSGSANNTASSNMTTTDQLTKLTKLKIDLEDKQHVYEEMNQTLCMALPVLYENRLKFYSSLLQTFFHTETAFNSESVESKSRLDEICESLSSLKAEIEPGSNNGNGNKKMNSLSGIERPSEFNSSHHSNNHHHHIHRDMDDSGDEVINEDADHKEQPEHVNHDYKNINNVVTEFMPKTNLNENCYSSNEDIEGTNGHENGSQDTGTHLTISQASNGDSINDNHLKPIVKDKVVFKVKATYPYEAKELDELTFTKEDLILVVEGTESEKEDLDDGWLIGIHEITNKRGLFPENFTKRI